MSEPRDERARGDDAADLDEFARAAPEAEPEPVVEPDDLSELEEQFEHDLEAIVAERDQFKDIAMRLQADFENYRKRVATQSAEEVDRATGRLAEAFLPVLDAAEAAYVRHPDEVGPLLNVMLAELRKHGLETLDLDGQPFDPEVAEAVTHDENGRQQQRPPQPRRSAGDPDQGSTRSRGDRGGRQPLRTARPRTSTTYPGRRRRRG